MWPLAVGVGHWDPAGVICMVINKDDGVLRLIAKTDVEKTPKTGAEDHSAFSVRIELAVNTPR